MLRTSSVLFLMVWTSAWKGSISGTSRLLLLGASAPGLLESQLCLLGLLRSPWCRFHAHHSGCVPTWWAHWQASGLTRGPRYHSEAWGEKSVGGGGAVLATEGSTTGPHQPVPA
jgi:hypothetical protein